MGELRLEYQGSLGGDADLLNSTQRQNGMEKRVNLKKLFSEVLIIAFIADRPYFRG